MSSRGLVGVLQERSNGVAVLVEDLKEAVDGRVGQNRRDNLLRRVPPCQHHQDGNERRLIVLVFGPTQQRRQGVQLRRRAETLHTGPVVEQSSDGS